MDYRKTRIQCRDVASCFNLPRDWGGIACRFIQYNAKVAYQPQARYFFLLLVPSALLLTGGLHSLAAKRVLRLAAVSVLLTAFGLLNALALVAVKDAGDGCNSSPHATHQAIKWHYRRRAEERRG